MSSNASRRVARAAASGRNSKARREIPVGFYSTIALLVIVGSLVVGYSRYEKQHPPAPTGPQPRIGQSWTVALGFDYCGTYLPNLTAQATGANHGLAALANGLVSVAPKTAAVAGTNATLANFLAGYKGLTVGPSSFRYPVPSAKTYSTAAGCGGKKSQLGIYVWPSLLAKTPTRVASAAKLHFSNSEIISVAILAKGQLPKEPASAVGLGGSTTTTAPSTSASVVTPSTTAAPASTTKTSTTKSGSASKTSSTTATTAG
ncbi:MAG: hypothetical protein ACP5O0_05345 [Acidimicrobiales bacterium]